MPLFETIVLEVSNVFKSGKRIKWNPRISVIEQIIEFDNFSTSNKLRLKQDLYIFTYVHIEDVSNFNNRNTEVNTYKKEKVSIWIFKVFLFQQLVSLDQMLLYTILTSKNGFQYISKCFDYWLYLNSILTDFASLMIDKCTFTVAHFLFGEKVTVSVNYLSNI